jgi:hypothetical protein
MNPGFVPGAVMPATMVVAFAAAEAARRREEDEMTGYTPDDLNHDWEFKIVRGNGATFRKPERLQAVLAEEARAGWELLEKLDDNRIRLKRPTSRRQLDGKLDIDPYRTQVGAGEAGRVLLVLGAVLLGLLALLATLVLVRSDAAPPATPAIEVRPIPPPPPPAPEARKAEFPRPQPE